MSRNNVYTTVNLSDYLYHQKYYKVIGIDLSRQTNTIISQQINFTKKLEEDDGANIFIIAEKQWKTILNYPKNYKNIGTRNNLKFTEWSK